MTSDPFRHILVAYDGSGQARAALDRAIDLARASSAHLTIVAVYQLPVIWTTGMSTGPLLSPEPPAEPERKAMNEVLQQAVQAAREGGVSDVRGELLQGHPAEAILSLVDQERADLIVMGSRGQSTTTRLLLGSVSDAVVHHAQVAVLIVRPRKRG
jgi:nucleotide-binding universal stress UspA family protein